MAAMHADSWPGNSKEKNQEYSLEQKKKKHAPFCIQQFCVFVFAAWEDWLTLGLSA